MKNTLTCACVVALLLTTACRKRTPVDEVSLDQSGIVVSEPEPTNISLPWAQWRGPSGDGLADDQVLPVQWSSSKNVQWSSDIPGRGHSSPIVVGDMVVVGTAVEKDSKQMVVAYDLETGSERWQTVVHKDGFPSQGDVHAKATHANSTLVSDGRQLITAHLNRTRVFVTALDLDGKQLWQTDIGAFGSKFGYAPSPVLYKSLVVVAADNFGGGYLVGLDRASGEVAWRRSRGDSSSYSSPHIATVGGVDQLLITGGDRLASYDPATGTPLWETKCISDATCGTVITTSEQIFASGGYPDKETVCLSATGERIWSNNTGVYEPSMITDGENVFAITDSGIANCWSAEDGAKRWRQRLGGNFSSSPVLCNGQVYVADLSGNCHVFAASGDSFQRIAENKLGSDCYASPAIADGSLFFRVGIGQGATRTEKLFRITESTD